MLGVDRESGGLAALARTNSGFAVANHSEKNLATLVEQMQTPETFDSLLTAKQGEDCELTQSSWICQLDKTLKAVIADFKGEYAAVLKLQVPAGPQGDSD